jgi:hypothetical protein
LPEDVWETQAAGSAIRADGALGALVWVMTILSLHDDLIATTGALQGCYRCPASLPLLTMIATK